MYYFLGFGPSKLIKFIWLTGNRFMQPLVSNVPTMLIEGEHEIEQQAENQTFAAYCSRFAFPSEESGSSSSLYYSFNAGGIHFVMLGAYTYYDKSCKLLMPVFCLPFTFPIIKVIIFVQSASLSQLFSCLIILKQEIRCPKINCKVGAFFRLPLHQKLLLS